MTGWKQQADAGEESARQLKDALKTKHCEESGDGAGSYFALEYAVVVIEAGVYKGKSET